MGAVIQDIRGYGGDQLQIYIDTVTLIGANLRPSLVKGKALFVVGNDDFLQFPLLDGKVVLFGGCQEFGNSHPAARLQSESDFFGMVAQMVAEVLADFDAAIGIHLAV